MNLKNPTEMIQKSMNTLTSIHNKLPKANSIPPKEYFTMLFQIENQIKNMEKITPEILKMKNEISEAKKIFFQSVLYPKKEEANTAGIYRIGTFMSYFVNNNRQRFFEDSLINNFE